MVSGIAFLSKMTLELIFRIHICVFVFIHTYMYTYICIHMCMKPDVLLPNSNPSVMKTNMRETHGLGSQPI